MMDQLLYEVLKMLWINAAEPILHALNFLAKTRNVQDLPRVWRMTRDRVSRLPTHAAGDHELAAQTGRRLNWVP